MSAITRLEIASVLDAAEMPAGPVRAGDELPRAQQLVGDHLAREADRAERAGVRAEGGADLVLRRRAGVRAECCEQLGLLEPVVAADEREHDCAVVLRIRHRLGRCRLVDVEQLRERLDRRRIRCLDLLRCGERRRERRLPRDGARDLDVGRVVAVLAGDERVLTGSRRREVVVATRFRPSSRARPRRRTSSGRSARRCGRTLRGSSRSLRRGRPGCGRTSTSPS